MRTRQLASPRHSTRRGIASELDVKLEWIEAEGMAGGSLDEALSGVDGILIPGGFGLRGVQGMLEAVRFARENRVPYFGICLGIRKCRTTDGTDEHG